MLTLQYVPYSQIENLSANQRIDKLLKLISENKIILLEGRLKKNEEASLIGKTMELISQSDENEFKGIELSTIDPCSSEDKKFVSTVKGYLMNLLLGDRQGMTIVGPASVVKEIKQDPEKIELFLTGQSSVVSKTSNDDKSSVEVKKSAITKKSASSSKTKKRRSVKKR